MLAIDRRHAILKKIQIEKSVKVPELSALYEVTEETIRRDLEKIEKDGHITRTYGGAVLNESTKADLPASVRETKNMEGKKRIGQRVSEMIKDGETIMMDSSTTSLYVAKYLHGKQNIIITNSLKIPNEMMRSEDSQVILTGGTLNGKSMSFVGHLAENALTNYFADVAIVSCRGLSRDKGIAEPDEMEAEIKRQMIKSAERIIMVVDHTKFDHKAFVRSYDFSDVDVVITDEPLTKEWEQFFTKKSIKVIKA